MKEGNGNESDWNALNKYREEIDSINGQIISLLSSRQDIAAAIGQIKRRLGIETFDPAREQEILTRLATSSTKGNLTEEAIRNIFNEILSAARSVQDPLTVAFLGPEATFTHQAAISLFGHSTSFRAAETIDKVFGLVEKGLCRHGVVPIENSYEGSVNSTLDLFYQHELKIGAEVFLRIRHHLLSKADTLKKIKQLYSHPMAIAQCRSWIKNHLEEIPITEVESTSRAASIAADDPYAAAVGSRLSALTYDLNMVAENIEDLPDNVTRFLAIGKNDTKATSRDKTSILFFLNHKPGSLYRALRPLAQRTINLSRIESRPMKRKNWEYLFFADLEGHEQDSNVHDAIKEMEGHCMFLKRLGSYPAGGEPWDETRF
jgi:chorismate mutase/prephenate dehydratase